MHIQELIRFLHPFGDCLEVGFTESSIEIHKYHPKSQTIIESDPIKAQAARKWGHAVIIEDIWQSALPQLGVFDTIFFGVDPHGNPLFEHLLKLRYQDHDLDELCKIVPVTNRKALARFLSELEQNLQITHEQREKMVQKYHLPEAKEPAWQRSDQMLHFLKACLLNHMRKGSRFSCFLSDDVSPTENPKFLSEIVANPDIDYKEEGRKILVENLT